MDYYRASLQEENGTKKIVLNEKGDSILISIQDWNNTIDALHSEQKKNKTLMRIHKQNINKMRNLKSPNKNSGYKFLSIKPYHLKTSVMAGNKKYDLFKITLETPHSLHENPQEALESISQELERDVFPLFEMDAYLADSKDPQGIKLLNSILYLSDNETGSFGNEALALFFTALEKFTPITKTEEQSNLEYFRTIQLQTKEINSMNLSMKMIFSLDNFMSRTNPLFIKHKPVLAFNYGLSSSLSGTHHNHLWNIDIYCSHLIPIPIDL